MNSDTKILKSNLKLFESEISKFESNELNAVLFLKHNSFSDFFKSYAFFAIRSELAANVSITAFSFYSGYSGYNFNTSDGTWGKVEIAFLQGGGFVVHKYLSIAGENKEAWDLYDEQGQATGSYSSFHPFLVATHSLQLDPLCPLANHLYCYLAFEYEQAKKGSARTKQVLAVENILAEAYAAGKASIKNGSRDAGILQFNARILAEELDPTLDWTERQILFKKIFSDRQILIETKTRAHKLLFKNFKLPIHFDDAKNYCKRFIRRPVDNFFGLSYRYTIGVMLWFLRTVRNNIGYSIALAIYGPFTFYFITQPLNPHAMWAVGKVRSQYIETLQGIQNKVMLLTGAAPAVISPVSSSPTTPVTPEASPAPAPELVSNAVVNANTHPASSQNIFNNLIKALPESLGFKLSSEVSDVDTQDWQKRMSNFKAMQIGFEENMQFAERMGRLEQMETQLNFPLIVEGAWAETNRYLEQMNIIRANMGPNLAKDIQQYFTNEEQRTFKIQLYIWDRFVRFLKDHPYVVLDDSKEQTQRDFYIGRSFLLLREMTQQIMRVRPQTKKSQDLDKIEAMAAGFSRLHKEGNDILDRLEKNSEIFSQKNRLDGDEMRSYMRRHWEILFLQQNKAQEAANSGLQLYTWSVRNTIWIMQSLYSAKTRELSIAFDRHGRFKGDVSSEVKSKIEPYFESLLHMLSLEYLSIQPEIKKRLGNDIEAQQREAIIKLLDESMRDREKYFKHIVK